MIDQQVTAQPRQPGDERALRRAVALERPEHAQEDILCKILRLGVAPGETVAQTVDPARVHLSYHWLWLVPRELAATFSSRSIARHDGRIFQLETFAAAGRQTTTTPATINQRGR